MKRVQHTIEDKVTERDFVLSLEEHVFSMLPRDKFKRGDRVRVTVVKLPTKRKGA